MDSPASGFTLIELLVVITVIGVLSAATIPSFNSFTQTQRLNQAAKQVKQDLRSAQNRALSSIGGRAWGIRFLNGDNLYTIFSCETSARPDYALTHADCSFFRAVDLPSGVTIVTPPHTDYTFDLVNGDVYIPGEIMPLAESFQLELGVSRRTITIYPGGKIED